MRIFTPEELNHQDINRAFTNHKSKKTSHTKPMSKAASKTTVPPDNLLIFIMLFLILLEMKEK